MKMKVKEESVKERRLWSRKKIYEETAKTSSLEKMQCQYGGIETLSGAHKTTLNGSSAYNIKQ